jgi:hypothetical protein
MGRDQHHDPLDRSRRTRDPAATTHVHHEESIFSNKLLAQQLACAIGDTSTRPHPEHAAKSSADHSNRTHGIADDFPVTIEAISVCGTAAVAAAEPRGQPHAPCGCRRRHNAWNDHTQHSIRQTYDRFSHEVPPSDSSGMSQLHLTERPATVDLRSGQKSLDSCHSTPEVQLVTGPQIWPRPVARSVSGVSGRRSRRCCPRGRRGRRGRRPTRPRDGRGPPVPPPAVELGHRDGPVEGDDRRGVESDELVVKGED